VKWLSLKRGKVHSNGNKETCVLFSRLQTERGVGEQNLSLPSQEEETWPRGGLIQMAGDGPTHNERKRVTAQEQMFLFAFCKQHKLCPLWILSLSLSPFWALSFQVNYVQRTPNSTLYLSIYPFSFSLL
jgi:hypothetical protein